MELVCALLAVLGSTAHRCVQCYLRDLILREALAKTLPIFNALATNQACCICRFVLGSHSKNGETARMAIGSPPVETSKGIAVLQT